MPTQTNKALIGSGVANDRGFFVYEINSQFRPGIKHTVKVRKDTGECTCSCEDFTKRHSKFNPFVWSEHVCKHIRGFRQELTKDVLGLEAEHTVTIAIEANDVRHYPFKIGYFIGGRELEMPDAHKRALSIEHAHRIGKSVRHGLDGVMNVRILNMSGVEF